MTIDFIAEASGLSPSTVERVLSGHYGSASFDAVMAIAETLGMDMTPTEAVDADTMLEQQAKRKARQLVGMVQGTSALEGQGVPESAYQSMLNQAVHSLMAGSRRKLWAS